MATRTLDQLSATVTVRLPLWEAERVVALAQQRGDKKLSSTLRDLVRAGLAAAQEQQQSDGGSK